MLTAFLFDLDGTMVHSDPIHFETWKEILEPYGLTFDEEFYRTRFSGRLNIQIIQDLLPQLSLEEGEALSLRKEAEFRQKAKTQLTPMPGLYDVMEWAQSRGIKRAVVTNAPVENARFMLDVLGLKTAFDTVVIGDDLPRGKPDPLPYEVAIANLETSAATAIAFEDSPSGVRSAVGAGVTTVGITSTQDPQVLRHLGVKLTVPDFTDPALGELLEELGGLRSSGATHVPS